MQIIRTIMLFTLIVTVLAGCDQQAQEQLLDCNKPANQQLRKACTDKAFIAPRGPDSLPANPPKW